MVPSLTNLPPGLRLRAALRAAIARCREEYPPLQDLGNGHLAACWRAAELVGAP